MQKNCSLEQIEERSVEVSKDSSMPNSNSSRMGKFSSGGREVIEEEKAEELLDVSI